jgi:hypothetical protein
MVRQTTKKRIPSLQRLFVPNQTSMSKGIKKEQGQKELIVDLESLLAEAKAGEFGDFTNEKYATPKVELRNKFLALAKNVENGKYD